MVAFFSVGTAYNNELITDSIFGSPTNSVLLMFIVKFIILGMTGSWEVLLHPAQTVLQSLMYQHNSLE